MLQLVRAAWLRLGAWRWLDEVQPGGADLQVGGAELLAAEPVVHAGLQPAHATHGQREREQRWAQIKPRGQPAERGSGERERRGGHREAFCVAAATEQLRAAPTARRGGRPMATARGRKSWTLGKRNSAARAAAGRAWRTEVGGGAGSPRSQVSDARGGPCLPAVFCH